MSEDNHKASEGYGDPVLGRLDQIPAPAVRRLSLYLRQLEHYLAEGRITVSSRELGAALSVHDAQVRKDLTYFGHFGHAGIGYVVEQLIAGLRRILGTDRIWNVVLIGAGNLGSALAAYRGFTKRGFQVIAVLDNDPEKIGKTIAPLPGLRIQPLDDLERTVRENDLQLAILAVPADHAQAVANRCIAAGIRGILNFAPITLNVPANIAVAGIDLAVHLEQLSYRVSLDRNTHKLPGG